MTTSVAGPPTGTGAGAVLALACAAQFVVVLDVAVVNVTLPSIRADLGLGADALHWVVVAYTLLLAARAVQGLGAALIPPAALATIAITFTDQAARSRALGLYGAVTGMSASVALLH